MTSAAADTGADPIDQLYWRDEILQIFFWLKGEGLGDAVKAGDLRVFFPQDAPDPEPYLEWMAQEGFLKPEPNGHYRLTDFGQKEGARRFQDAFDGLTKPGHGECSEDCICHTTGDPANCISKDVNHVHNH